MARPPTTVIESARTGDFEWTIAATPANWEVVRFNQPIYIIKQHWLQDRKTYPRSVFSNAAHAQNLADKLNALFKTSAYTIRKIT
jgi:hypothetical protein